MGFSPRRTTGQDGFGRKEAGSGSDWSGSPALVLVALGFDHTVRHPCPVSKPPTSGVIGTDWYATHVAVRLHDFFFATTPWQRRLWDAGTPFMLRELLDAARWRGENVLSAGSVSWLAHELHRIAGRDVGVGAADVRRRLNDELPKAVDPDTRHWRAVEQMLPTIENDYLRRWMISVDEAQPPGAERVARVIAAHLLDKGYSQAYLARWVKKHIDEKVSLGELILDACRLASEPESTFEVLLPFIKMPKPQIARSQLNWRSSQQVAQWLNEHQDPSAKRTDLRHVGGFIYEIPARDVGAATRTVAGIRDRLFARASYVSGFGRMEAAAIVWIRDVGATSPGVVTRSLDAERRGTYVRSLLRENKLHDVGIQSTALDDALELAAALNNSTSRGPALTSGWSALESLLFSPGDPQDAKDGRGAVVCDRASELVSCSWPRAELTALTYADTTIASSPSNLNGEHATRLDNSRGMPPTALDSATLRSDFDASSSNLERCRTLLASYSNSLRLDLSEPSDIAAQERMLSLLNNPRTTLNEVRGHVQHAFRRMYRMRNIVVHGGAASSSGLEVALRTTAPLVGAALDRIAHAQLVDGVHPLALAARASVSLDLADVTTGVADLLA